MELENENDEVDFCNKNMRQPITEHAADAQFLVNECS